MKISFKNTAVIPINEKREQTKSQTPNKNRNITSHNEIIPYRSLYLNINQNTSNSKNKPDKKLENYEFARNFFEKNVESKKPLLGNIDNIGEILSNDKIRRNVCKYFVERSEKELSQIKDVNFNDKEQIDKIKGLIQVRDFFNDFLEVWPENNITNPYTPYTQQISFAGKLESKDKKHCQNLVHTISAACSATSAAMGEGGAIGADTPILRTLQGAMFLYMQQYLKVPLIASSEYTMRELLSGAVLGVEGAKIITSWLGIGAHAASAGTGTTVVTGGTSHAAITGGVRAVNASLSGLITEKMGRGYINSVERNQMNFKDQSVRLGTYLAGKGLLTGENPFNKLIDKSVINACDPEKLQAAYEQIDSGTKNIFGNFLDIMTDNSANRVANYTAKLATYTVLDVGQNLILAKDKSPENMKELAKNAFKQAFLRASVYEICDLAVDETITQNAKETIEQMSENLEEYPEVFEAFEKAENNFIKNLNIDKLDSEEFRRQFKNKRFVFDTTNLVRGDLKEFSTAWRNRKNKLQARQILNSQEEMNKLNKQREINSTLIDTTDKKEIESSVNEMIRELSLAKELLSKKDGFGYGRIAGYEKQKDLLTTKMILPISQDKEGLFSQLPQILFYGPTGTGKSTMALALAEQARCRGEKFKTLYPDEILLSKLTKKIEMAEKLYKDQNKRTILLIDEVDNLNEKPKTLEFIKNFIENEAKDKHVSFIFTTNNPSIVDSELMNLSTKIAMGPASDEDIKEILEYYLSKNSIPNLNYNKIQKELKDTTNDASYSNSQIEEISNNAIASAEREERLVNDEDVINQIKIIYPEIAKNDKVLFYNDCKIFN